MKAVLILCGSLLLAPATWAKGADAANGQSLFVNSPCDTPALTTPNPAITDKAALEKQVRACDIERNINWFDDEILDVVAYLNQTYYHFP